MKFNERFLSTSQSRPQKNKILGLIAVRTLKKKEEEDISHKFWTPEKRASRVQWKRELI